MKDYERYKFYMHTYIFRDTSQKFMVFTKILKNFD